MLGTVFVRGAVYRRGLELFPPGSGRYSRPSSLRRSVWGPPGAAPRSATCLTPGTEARVDSHIRLWEKSHRLEAGSVSHLGVRMISRSEFSDTGRSCRPISLAIRQKGLWEQRVPVVGSAKRLSEVKTLEIRVGGLSRGVLLVVGPTVAVCLLLLMLLPPLLLLLLVQIVRIIRWPW